MSCLPILVAIVAPVLSPWQDPPTAQEISSKVDDRCEAVRTASIAAVSRLRTMELRAGNSRDALDQRLWRAFGSEPGSPTKLRTENSTTGQTIVSDGTRAIAINDADKTYAELDLSSLRAFDPVFGLDWPIRALRRTGRPQEPGRAEGTAYEHEGEEILGDATCDILRESIDTNTVVEVHGTKHTIRLRATNTYAIARSDGLPRRFEQRIGSSLERPDLDPPVTIHFEILGIDRPSDPDRFIVPTTAELEARGYSKSSPVARRPPTAQRGLIDIGAVAPEFSLKDLDGNELRLSSLRGKVVVLDFWASWCGPCKRAMPFLEELHKSFEADSATEGKVVVLGLNTSEPDQADARRVFEEQSLTYRCLLDADRVALEYGVTGLPVILVIDREGRVALRDVGFGGAGFMDRMRASIVEAAKPREQSTP